MDAKLKYCRFKHAQLYFRYEERTANTLWQKLPSDQHDENYLSINKKKSIIVYVGLSFMATS